VIPIESLTTFVIASVLLALVPGPDNIFVLTQSSVNGHKAGLLVTLGLCTGLIVHTSAVALGITAVLKTSYVAFTVLKIAGAMYLLYLAWRAFHASSEEISTGQSREVAAIKYYLRGVIMNVTNPKVSIFFLAFLPQFADPSRGPVIQQIFFLGMIFILVTLLVFGGIALLAGAVGAWLTNTPRAQTIMNRIAGAVFVAMALKLVTANINT
jgi:threonine/homoserine/homoserine lactone efflux protein